MQFSIITPTYKRPDTLKRAIESVLAQDIPTWEMIIINDNPGDGTRAIVTSYSDTRIVFLENEKNKGVNATRNAGLAAISPESNRVIFLDDDDYLAPTALSQLVEICTHTLSPWVVTARGNRLDAPTTTAPVSPQYYSYTADYLVRRRLQGDATHCIDTIYINGTIALLRFPTRIVQAEEWLFYSELGSYTDLYFENTVTTLTDGYQDAGLNLRRRTFREQIQTIPLLVKEAHGRRLYTSPMFWFYIGMRIIRSVIK